MILVRNTFTLKFGKTREAVALLKESVAVQEAAGIKVHSRILTDISGNFYTLILETTHDSLAAWEGQMPQLMKNPEFQAGYRKFAELVDSGHREIFTIVS